MPSGGVTALTTDVALGRSQGGVRTKAVACCDRRGRALAFRLPSRHRVKERGTLPMVQVIFDKAGCAACEARSLCTRKKVEPCELTLHMQAHHEAMVTARERQTTDAFWDVYRSRAGIEGAISQGVQTCGLRRTRYRELAKTHLQHVATATALNLKRAVTWSNRVTTLEVVRLSVRAAYAELRECANGMSLSIKSSRTTSGCAGRPLRCGPGRGPAGIAVADATPASRASTTTGSRALVKLLDFDRHTLKIGRGRRRGAATGGAAAGSRKSGGRR